MGYTSNRSDGPPGWFVTLLAIALIFGAYYAWINIREFMRLGGLSIAEATLQSQIDQTATQERRIVLATTLPTRRPTATPRAECLDFEVTAENANLRASPSTQSSFVSALARGTIICVLDTVAGEGEFRWYLIDSDPITRRIEEAYIREDIVRASNPTPTTAPTQTPSRAPTRISATPAPTTPTPRPSNTAQPQIFPSVTPLPTTTNTPPGIGV